MEKTTVVSVRVPEKIVKKLKETNVNIAEIMRKAFLKEYEKQLIKRIKLQGKRLSKLSDAEIVSAIKEDRK